MAKVEITKAENIPDGDHFAIVRDSPDGDLMYVAYTDRAEWLADIERGTLMGGVFKALMVQTASAKVEVKLDRPPVGGKS